jgi:hypothetical protein
MPLLRNVGRRIGRGVTSHPRATTAAALAVGVPALMAGSIIHDALTVQEKDTPFLDAMFELSTGHPQLDREILGEDIGLSDLFPIPGDIPGPVGRFFRAADTLRMSNPTVIGDLGYRLDDHKYSRRVAERNVEQGYSDYPYPNSGYSYSPKVTNATGDIVFGAYNLRHR